MLLEKLLNETGVSGDEDRIRFMIIEEIKDYVDDITVDTMGNVIAFKKGKCSDKKIMLSAHMDEVGFIISRITDTGYLRFKTVGGIDNRVLIGKRVVVGDGIKGVIGIKAVHLTTKAERETVPTADKLYIDIGATSKEDAKKYVSIGAYATFDTTYKEIGGRKILAKAIDDRAGVYCIINALKSECEYDLYGCFSVQEEVGLRGSTVLAYRINPDVALVLESTTCSDVYKTEPYQQVTKCGGGIAFSFMDRTTIVKSEFLEIVKKIAEDNKIPYQLKMTTMGGNDAGAIHLAKNGVLCASVSVPCRYLHSPAGVASLDDIEALNNYVSVFLKEIGGLLKWNS